MNVSGLGFGSRKEAENSLFSEKFKLALQPTQTSTQCVTRSFPGGKVVGVGC